MVLWFCAIIYHIECFQVLRSLRDLHRSMGCKYIVEESCDRTANWRQVCDAIGSRCGWTLAVIGAGVDKTGLHLCTLVCVSPQVGNVVLKAVLTSVASSEARLVICGS